MTLAEYRETTPPLVKWSKSGKVHRILYRCDYDYLRKEDGGMETHCGKIAPASAEIVDAKNLRSIFQVAIRDSNRCVSCFQSGH